MTIFSLLIVLASTPLLIADEPIIEPVEQEQSVPWVMDISVAKEMAAKEGKDILINFTGSDWCGWCKRLDSEVFVHSIFQETASKQYVYLYLDFPRGEEAKAKVVDEELNNQNRDQMGVNGFPTIILADSQMRPYARTGYQPGGPEKYLDHLAQLRTEGDKIKALITATDEEQVQKLLADAFTVLTKQKLLGHPGFSKFLEMAEKSDNPKLVEQVVAFRARQKLAEFMNTQEPDFPALTKFLEENPTLQGDEVLNALWFCSQWLSDNDRKDDAKLFLQRMLTDPLLKGNDRGREMIDKAIHDIDHGLGEEGGGHDHDGDGVPDH
ncbi:MAG: thioredoxin family protein [Planctomycetota bacterium]|nr:thioredoxin family protein [Planctomycetota bacterium]